MSKPAPRLSERQGHGFTLLEVMIVVVVIGILASMALLSYRKMLERSYLREANDILLSIYAGEKTYFWANDLYYTVGSWDDIFVENPNISSIPVTFAVSCTGVCAGFVATATRTNGPCSGMIVSIDQTRTTPLAGDTWPGCPAL